MTADPISLHANVRRAHAESARALAAVAVYYQQQAAESAAVAETIEGLQLVHAVMARAERSIRDVLDGRPMKPEKTPKQWDHERRIALCEQMIRIGTSPNLAARTLGFGESRSLYRWLRAQGRPELADKLIKGKVA